MKQLVSIIMPTFNRAHFIEESLRAIQKQTYADFECLIIDDGSTDNTKEIVESFLQQDSRFNYFKRPNEYTKGPSGCRNFGLDQAQGDYIFFFDDDDIPHPVNIYLCLQAIKVNNYDFCRYGRKTFHGGFDYKFNSFENVNNFEITTSDLKKIIENKLPFSCCQVMWKKSVINKLRFNESLIYAEEWEFYVRILIQGIRGVNLGKTIYFVRKHAESSTGKFWNNDPIRIASKKKAIHLITANLYKKKLLSADLLRYLASLATGFRDKKLLNSLLTYVRDDRSLKTDLKLRYFLFPLWKQYKRVTK